MEWQVVSLDHRCIIWWCMSQNSDMYLWQCITCFIQKKYSSYESLRQQYLVQTFNLPMFWKDFDKKRKKISKIQKFWNVCCISIKQTKNVTGFSISSIPHSEFMLSKDYMLGTNTVNPYFTIIKYLGERCGMQFLKYVFYKCLIR